MKFDKKLKKIVNEVRSSCVADKLKDKNIKFLYHATYGPLIPEIKTQA